jgi:hypothetical protein
MHPTIIPDNFCVFILTHGRPNKVYTINSLKKSGYTGKVYIVIDNEDKTAEEYRKKYNNVLIFDKKKTAKTFDEGDNFNDRRAIIYARNACFDLAKKVNCRYFVQLDDDYTGFFYRFDDKLKYAFKPIKSLDAILCAMLRFYQKTPFSSIAMAQGGDYLGGELSTMANSVKGKRKAMNSFLCDTENPFSFVGRINEDVNTYTALQRAGLTFLTLNQVSLGQKTTQKNKGGMTELYRDSGTYVKSFYSIMYAPSCVKIKEMGQTNRRLHHCVNWDKAAPLIIEEKHKKVFYDR